jgi:hypothetical protein
MGLLMELDRCYILESWKKIIANATATVNTLARLLMVFYRRYVIFTDGYTNRIKRVNLIFGVLCLFVNPSIYFLLIDSLIIHKLSTRVFPMDCFCP